MTSINRSIDLLLRFLIAFISLTLFIQLVHAQSPFSPTPAGGSASAFIEGKDFYIQSGFTAQGKTRQAFSISHRYSWNITSPVYTQLPDGINDFWFPNTLLKDGTTWFGISNSTHVTYDILTGNITHC